jgi:hypothetical protein
MDPLGEKSITGKEAQHKPLPLHYYLRIRAAIAEKGRRILHA